MNDFKHAHFTIVGYNATYTFGPQPSIKSLRVQSKKFRQSKKIPSLSWWLSSTSDLSLLYEVFWWIICEYKWQWYLQSENIWVKTWSAICSKAVQMLSVQENYSIHRKSSYITISTQQTRPSHANHWLWYSAIRKFTPTTILHALPLVIIQLET